MEGRLQNQLGALLETMSRARLFRSLAMCWAIAAAVGLALLVSESVMGHERHRIIWIIPLVAGGILVAVMLAGLKRQAGAFPAE